MAIYSNELGLPVYDWESVKHSHAEMYGPHYNNTFVRSVDYGISLSELALSDALTSADREFEFAASVCDAAVIQHRWGLALIPKDSILSLPKRPKFMLVAEVATVTCVQSIPAGALQRIQAGVRHYSTLTRPFMWDDCKPENFTYGKTAADPTPRSYLTDIGLWFRMERNETNACGAEM